MQVAPVPGGSTWKCPVNQQSYYWVQFCGKLNISGASDWIGWLVRQLVGGYIFRRGMFPMQSQCIGERILLAAIVPQLWHEYVGRHGSVTAAPIKREPLHTERCSKQLH